MTLSLTEGHCKDVVEIYAYDSSLNIDFSGTIFEKDVIISGFPSAIFPTTLNSFKADNAKLQGQLIFQNIQLGKELGNCTFPKQGIFRNSPTIEESISEAVSL